MSEAKTKKTVAAKKPASNHPKYIDMVVEAIKALKERSGSSRIAILKYIIANFDVRDNCNPHVKLALKRGVITGTLLQPKGVGASGSFKLNKKVDEKKPKTTVAATKKKTVVKKTIKKKTPTKKAKKSTTPKKAAKKPASAKKAAKKPVKKTVTKKPAPKKAKAAKRTTPKKRAKK